MYKSFTALTLLAVGLLTSLPLKAAAEDQTTFLLKRNGITWSIGNSETTRYGAIFQLYADGSLAEDSRATSFIFETNCYRNTLTLLSTRAYLKKGGYSQSDEVTALAEFSQDSPVGMAQNMVCSWFFNSR
ncbi:hypothetical protein BST81_02130 [Leptolyngbya sp. 'hensonii']|uniref:hypothetical protein n=1 Tax=Leptolyngbya sp. 'hensonii' TaxID=1922337 RepID=UPI00094FA3FD|nr:hypothetical protein [Leptolyngbya sp. 'hensonii']OLP20059.1 hypothetical protein BST81_02130 [Leptolyngbya sp. 'hensonii']